MIKIVANFSIKPDCTEQFIRAARDVSRETRKENGNLSYRIYRERKDETKFVFIEEWVNDVVIEKHNSMPHFTAFLEAIRPLTADEPKIVQYMNVPEIRNI